MEILIYIACILIGIFTGLLAIALLEGPVKGYFLNKELAERTKRRI